MVAKSKKKKVVCSPDEHCFLVSDGSTLKSLEALSHSLSTISPSAFAHHVNDFKNDFAQWTEDIFHEKELAAAMRKVKTRAGLKKKLDVFLEAL